MDIQPLEILKWIGIVLAAGFVGYFGRYLAMMILRQAGRKEPEAGKSDGGDIRIEEARLKLEKKKAKQAAKQAKKESKK